MNKEITYVIMGSKLRADIEGSTNIIPAVPPQDRSDGHRISGTRKNLALIWLYALVLVSIIAHPSQGTAISAWMNRHGTWLARLQLGLGVHLDWTERIPQLFITQSAPSIPCTLPYGVHTEEAKDRLFALFRQERRVTKYKKKDHLCDEVVSPGLVNRLRRPNVTTIY